MSRSRLGLEEPRYPRVQEVLGSAPQSRCAHIQDPLIASRQTRRFTSAGSIRASIHRRHRLNQRVVLVHSRDRQSCVERHLALGCASGSSSPDARDHKVPSSAAIGVSVSLLDVNREELTAWITDKYNGKFMKRPTWSQEALNRSMFDAVNREDIFEGLRLIALGVDLNFMNKDEELRTVLHQAVDKGSEVFVEMLVQNGTRPRCLPHLHHHHHCRRCRRERERRRGARLDAIALRGMKK